jgi:trk system potassium uptake protein TrkH
VYFVKKALLIIILVLGIGGLFLEQQSDFLPNSNLILSLVDYTLLAAIFLETLIAFLQAPLKKYYVRKNFWSLIFLLVYIGFFALNRVMSVDSAESSFKGYFLLAVIRNLAMFFKLYTRVKRLSGFLQSIFSKPAQTVVISFLLVILVGTLLLMMPMMNVSGKIAVEDAFFTVTSAVCVTGLVVLDTPTDFTLAGQIVILGLIQIGGLGIMLLSYFLVFSFRRSVSIQDRQILSYMLNASDIKGIVKSITRIIGITFSIEAAGAALLIPVFLHRGMPPGRAVFQGIFHSISAFCNAGFALYSDSLSGFYNSPALNFIIAGLIIAGGISFAVLTEMTSWLKSLLGRKRSFVSVNTKVVLRITVVLIVVSTLVIYRLEYNSLLYPLGVHEQYLAAFFQAVTLRTAGFNTLPFDRFSGGTLIFMMGVMFIGGASGSTAGGIKVNTLGVVWGYIRSLRREKHEVLLFRKAIPRDQILQAFTVIIFGMLVVFFAAFFLLLVEDSEPVDILFETVSAFATVGLSTGITPNLTLLGKIIISTVMFIGRLGPLTILSASSSSERSSRISYPETNILIG